MTTLKELLAQQEALEKQIAETREQELTEVIGKIRAAITEYGLTEKDLFGGSRSARKDKRTGTKIAAKYRDPASGLTWTGRGRTPKWMEGKDKKKFAIS